MKRYVCKVEQCFTKGHGEWQKVQLVCLADSPTRARAIFDQRIAKWKKLNVEIRFVGEPCEAPKKV